MVFTSFFSFDSKSLIFEINWKNKSLLSISFIGNCISIFSNKLIGNIIYKLKTSFFFFSIAKLSFFVNCSNSIIRLSIL